MSEFLNLAGVLIIYIDAKPVYSLNLLCAIMSIGWFFKNIFNLQEEMCLLLCRTLNLPLVYIYLEMLLVDCFLS